MNDNFKQLENLSVPKAVLKNAIPSMIAMIMALVYNMADLFFVGQTGDPFQVAAVSMATPIFVIFMSIGNVFGIGGVSYIARSLGGGNRERAKKISSFCFWSCVVIGAVMASAIFLSSNAILQVLGATENIYAMVKSYLQIFCLAGPFVLFTSCFSNLLRGEGQAGKAMVGMLVGNLVNIVLDPIFILVLGLGVQGAAIATVIGNVCGGMYYFRYMFKGNTILSLNIKYFTTKDGILKNVLCIGIPASLATILMSVAQIILNGQMVKYGDLPLAGVGVALKVTMLTNMLCIGFGQGVQPLLGYSVGAQDEKRYKQIMKFALAFAFGLSATLTAICYITLPQIVGAFLSDADAYQYAYSFSQMLLSSSVIFGMLYILSNALQATGSAKESLIVNVSRQGLLYIPLLFILNAQFGMYGLVCAQPIADISAFVLALILYRSASKKVFALSSGGTI